MLESTYATRMFLPITTLCLAGCLLAASRERRSGLFLGLTGWTVMLAATAFPLLRFNVDYSLLADLVIGGSLIAVTAGYLLARVPADGHQPTDKSAEWIGETLALVGIAGSTLLLFDGYLSGIDLNPLTAVDRLSETRGAAFERLQAGEEGTVLSRLGLFVAPASYLSVIIATELRATARKRFKVLTAISLILLLAVGLLIYGGRSIPLYAGILALVCWYLTGGQVRLSGARLAAGVVASMVIAFFAISFVKSREADNVSPEAQLVSLARAEPHPSVAPLVQGNDTVGSALVSYSYFASNVPSFSFYMAQERPGPLWGEYSFPLLYQFGGLAVGEAARPWIQARDEVFGPLEANGYFGNIWATWLRDLVVDFGILGALVFCALVGVFMGIMRNCHARTGRVEYGALEVLSAFIFAFGAFTGLLYFTFIAVAFAMGAAIWVLRFFVSPAARSPTRAERVSAPTKLKA